MKVRAEPVISPEAEQSGGNLLRLKGGQPQSFDIGLRQDAFQQPFEVNTVVAVRAYFGAGEHHFLVAVSNTTANLGNNFIGWQAGLSATYQRHNAVRAGGIAAVLHLDKGAGPVCRWPGCSGSFV